jgi:microcystin-dependent protein
MRCYESLPYGWYLECTTAGTAGSSDITIPSPLDVGDTVTDGTVVWTIRKIGSGDGFAVGDIIMIAGNNTIRDGWLECDGRAVSRAMFPDLFDAIGTTYGAGDGSTTFNLPNYSDGKFPEGSTVAGVVKHPGLPNIEGSTGSDNNICLWHNWSNLQGAFSQSSSVNAYSSDNGYQARGDISFDASISNPIYGASNTVQPYSLTTRYIIKAYDGVTPTPSQADISEMLTELTGKADRDLDNLSTTGEARFAHVVVDSYYDATTGDWWREYADGWIEQGGIFPKNGSTPISLLKPMSDTNYHIDCILISSNTSETYHPMILKSNITTTTILLGAGQQGTAYTTPYAPIRWQISGMGAQS